MLASEARCTACPLYQGTQHQLLDGDGPRNAEVVIVGEAPGEAEDKLGKPFVGRSGALLNTLLEQAGLKRSEVFVTNAVRCRPPYTGNKQQKPTAAQIKACKPHLIRELHEIKPKTIITLGNESLRSLTGMSGISAYRGSTQKLHKDVTWIGAPDVMPTFHPAYALRYPEHETEIVQDMTTAVRLLRGGFEQIDTSWIMAGSITQDVGQEYLDVNEPLWSWDIETNARDMHDPDLKVWFLSIDDGKRVVIYRGEEWIELAALVMNEYLAYVRPGADSPGWLVGHNASAYDRMVMKEKYGVNLKSHDTQLLAHLVDETQSLKLQNLAVRELGIAPWKDDFDVHFWYRGPQTEDEWLRAIEYNARDTRYTRLLFLQLWEQATDWEKKLYREHNLPASRALAQMERNGVYINTANAKAAIAELELEQREAFCALKWQTMVNRPEFNPGSAQQVRELLFSDMMLPQQNQTSGGEASTDVEALKRLRSMNLGGSIIDNILKYREAGTLLGFPRAFLERATTTWTDKKGKLHPCLIPPYIFPSYSMTSTETGRTSSFGPNLQNTPQDHRVRSCVSAPPGFVFIECDGSQMELRFAGEFAGPKSALFQEYLKPKPDVHMAMAMRLTRKDDPALVTKDERTEAKPSNFNFLYNPGARAWATHQRLSLENFDRVLTERECRFAQDAFKEWGVSPFWDRIKAELEERGRVTSIFGRNRRLPNIRSRDEYERLKAWGQGINAVVSSAASDFFLMFLTIITGRGFHVVGAIHDAAHVLVPNDPAHIESASAWLKYSFEVETPALVEQIFGYRFQLPMQADITVGRWWGDRGK
jgi:uracil-DNA glycosylase family 4